MKQGRKLATPARKDLRCRYPTRRRPHHYTPQPVQVGVPRSNPAGGRRPGSRSCCARARFASDNGGHTGRGHATVPGQIRHNEGRTMFRQTTWVALVIATIATIWMVASNPPKSVSGPDRWPDGTSCNRTSAISCGQFACAARLCHCAGSTRPDEDPRVLEWPPRRRPAGPVGPRGTALEKSCRSCASCCQSSPEYADEGE